MMNYILKDSHPMGSLQTEVSGHSRCGLFTVDTSTSVGPLSPFYLRNQSRCKEKRSPQDCADP